MTPTVLVYGEDKFQPEEYLGAYNSSPLNDFICNYCDNTGYGLSSDIYSGEHHSVIPAAAVEPAVFNPMEAIHETAASIDVLRLFATNARSGKYDIRGDITK